MRTPFESITTPGTALAAASSVFANFNSSDAAQGPDAEGPTPGLCSFTRDTNLEGALLRSFVYSFFARAFEDPSEKNWQWLHSPETIALLKTAAHQLTTHSQFRVAFEAAEEQLGAGHFDDFASDYIAAFGHAARGRCPMNEIEYGDAQADPLFQPHRLADLAAFYRAFGLELAVDAAERQDHLCIELEFMSVLAAREGYACAHSNSDGLRAALDAERKFLREHLGRWGVAFSTRLACEAGAGILAGVAMLLRAFIQDECCLFGVAPGADILALRPVNQADESLCASCGIHALPPGAAPVSE